MDHGALLLLWMGGGEEEQKPISRKQICPLHFLPTSAPNQTCSNHKPQGDDDAADRHDPIASTLPPPLRRTRKLLLRLLDALEVGGGGGRRCGV